MKSPRMISSFFCCGLGFSIVVKPTYVPSTRFCTSAAMRGSISLAITRRHTGRILTVRLPVPGPTSRTTSVGLSSALSTILMSALTLALT